MIRLAFPLALLLLPLGFVALQFAYRRGWRRVQPALRFSDGRLVANMPTSWRVRWRGLADGLRVVSLIMLVVALARPQVGQAQQMVRGRGLNIVLALDISGSMAALDFAPGNRLEAARSVMRRFVSNRPFDRIGLVVFSRDAYQLVPPTLDHTYLLARLDSLGLGVELGLEDGTAIGTGLAASGNMLRAVKSSDRVIILLTDGANNAGDIGPVTAAEAVAALGIRVYTVGVGTTGPVPVPDGQGGTRMVDSEVDEGTLEAIAKATRGRHYSALDLTDLEQIYHEIDVLEKSEVELQTFVRWQERTGVVLMVLIGLLVIEALLRATVLQSLP